VGVGAAGDAAQQGEQLRHRQGLADGAGDAQAEGGGEAGGGLTHALVEAGDEHQHGVEPSAGDAAQELDAVVVAQAEVEHDDVEGGAGEVELRFRQGGGGLGLVAEGGGGTGDQEALDRLVVHDQHPGAAHRVGGRGRLGGDAFDGLFHAPHPREAGLRGG
jgi:hypothetical protein